MRFEDLAKGCLEVPAGLRDVDVRALACDSRQVVPGTVFVAVRGDQADGHLFADEAARNGALAVVGDRFPAGGAGSPPQPSPEDHGVARVAAALATLRVPYLRVADSRLALGVLSANFFAHAHRSLKLAGVTGTKGKTTTAWVLDSIFRARGHVSGLFGTVHNRVGDVVLPSTNTTPSSLELHRHFRDLTLRGGTHAVLEVSSHGIAQKRTAGFAFDVAILTNIAPEHLDYHRTFENYLETKARLFRELPPQAVAVLPRGEPNVELVSRGVAARIAWYGAGSADGVENVHTGCGGMRFTFKGCQVRTRLWGRHNLLNLLAAMTAAECLGFTPRDIARGVAGAATPPGRLESIENPQGLQVLVDYAHTDGSLEAVLRAVRQVTAGRIITVFGCGGDRDREKRPRMGRVAEQSSDRIVVTSDNPRGEPPQDILDDIRRGLERPHLAVFEPDRRAAIAAGIGMARRGDTVLIAGKGHETYQEAGEERVHFDDREVARELLWNRSS